MQQEINTAKVHLLLQRRKKKTSFGEPASLRKAHFTLCQCDTDWKQMFEFREHFYHVFNSKAHIYLHMYIIVSYHNS